MGHKLSVLNEVFYSDIPVPNDSRLEIIKRGSAALQNKDGPFKSVLRESTRYRLSPIYGLVLQGNARWGKRLRSWMVYLLPFLYCKYH